MAGNERPACERPQRYGVPASAGETFIVVGHSKTFGSLGRSKVSDRLKPGLHTFEAPIRTCARASCLLFLNCETAAEHSDKGGAGDRPPCLARACLLAAPKGAA